MTEPPARSCSTSGRLRWATCRPPSPARRLSQLYVHLTVEAGPPADPGQPGEVGVASRLPRLRCGRNTYDRVPLARLAGYYNLSLSYRGDADLVAPYGRVVQLRPLPPSLQQHIGNCHLLAVTAQALLVGCRTMTLYSEVRSRPRWTGGCPGHPAAPRRPVRLQLPQRQRAGAGAGRPAAPDVCI